MSGNQETGNFFVYENLDVNTIGFSLSQQYRQKMDLWLKGCSVNGLQLSRGQLAKLIVISTIENGWEKFLEKNFPMGVDIFSK